MKIVELLIVDDNEIFLNGLKTLLELKNQDFHVKGTARDGQEAIAYLKENKVDIVLLDIKMPRMGGDLAMEIIHEKWPDIVVIMLTTFNDLSLIKTCLMNGAAGYLLKDTPVSNIASAIRSSLMGNIQISPEAALSLLTQKEENQINQLSSREQEILLCISRGMNNTEIGEELYISEGTVRNYVSNIYKISGMDSRKKLISWAHSFGID